MTSAEFEKLRQKVKQLEEIKSKTDNKIIKEQNSIIEKMASTLDITEVSDEVLILRAKVLKHPDLKPILEKYQIPINDVAFVRWNEYHSGWYMIGGSSEAARLLAW